MRIITAAILATVIGMGAASAKNHGPNDCTSDNPKTKPIVTLNQDGSTTKVWPTNCRYIPTAENVAVGEDPSFAAPGSSAEDSGGAGGAE